MTTPRFALWPAAALLVGCVTINIYFPAAAAEKAADVIIQEILNSAPNQPQPDQSSNQNTDPASGSSPQATLSPAVVVWLSRLQPAVDWLIAPAQAAQANLSVKTAAIDRIRASMKQRFALLQPHFNSGTIGLTPDGLVALRNVSGLPLAQRAKLNQLVAAENRDRNGLYKEIARANDHPEWETQIRSTFAGRWVKNAVTGWWYQESGGWLQK